MKKVSAILTGDWHLREDQPICRTDDFWETQWRKVKFISDLQEQHDCVVIHSGDLFDHWKPSPYLLSTTIKYLPKQFYTIYGNHDLPQHNLELAEKCGVNVLREARRLNVLGGTHWNQRPEVASLLFSPTGLEIRMLVWHVMTWVGSSPWPGCTDKRAEQLLKEFPEFTLIVTGHNHQSFVAKLKGRILVNPGSITRQKADQENHQPCVFLWYAETNAIEEVLIPIEHDVITREHLDRKKDRDNRLEAFISQLSSDWEASISFEGNLQKIIQSSNIRKSVIQIIDKAVFI